MKLEKGFDILQHIQSRPKKEICFAHKKRGEWVGYSSDDYVAISGYICIGLHKKGIKKGDSVISMTNDRPEWNFVDMGIQMAGGIHVPVPITASDEEIEHILTETGSKTIFVSSKIVLARFNKILKKINPGYIIYTFAEVKNEANYSELIELGKTNYSTHLLEKLKSQVNPEDIAAILYTSGTTSKPKGVMISHQNLASMPEIFPDSLPFDPSFKTALSIIPLSHIAGRKNNFVYQYLGISVYYGETGTDITKIFKEVKPDVTVIVPLQLDRVYHQLTTSSSKYKSFQAINKYVVKLTQSYRPGSDMKMFAKIQLSIANKLFYPRWKKLLGGRLKFIICGGASVPEHLLKFFWAIKLPVYEIYGMTETSALISVNRPGSIKFGTVGKPYPLVAVKLTEDSELICRGPNIMKGYFKQDALTKEAVDPEGFFHTGDICQIDEDGYIKITGRKKEVFKTASGEFIVPEIIENKLKRSSFINHAIIVGENRNFLSAIIVPNFDTLKAWAKANNIHHTNIDELITNESTFQLFRNEIDIHYHSLLNIENIKTFTLLNHAWSAASGELSSFMKPKRKFIMEKYSLEIEQLYP